MDYPSPAVFSFMLMIADGSPGSAASFAEVSGFSPEQAGGTGAAHGANRFAFKLPGRVRPDNLVLKRGMIAAASPLADWIAQTLGNSLATPVVPHTLSLVLNGADGKALMRWTFAGAWPVKWNISSIAEEGAILIESLEFAYASVARG